MSESSVPLRSPFDNINKKETSTKQIAIVDSPYRSIRRRNPPEPPTVPEEPIESPQDVAIAKACEEMNAFANRGRRNKTISVAKKLELLRCTTDDIWFMLEILGASLHWPWNRWPLQDGLVPEDSHFNQVKRGVPKLNDVINSFARHVNIIALPRLEYLEECGITFAVIGTVLIIDVDWHNVAQGISFSQRVDAILSVLPFPHFIFMSSWSCGYHIYVPTAFLNRYVTLDDDGTPHCRCDIRGTTFDLTWETEVFADIAAEFKRLGLTEGIEIWPKGNTPLRLPMGPGSYLILPDGQRVESFADVVAWLREFDRMNNAIYPSPCDILAYLQRLPRSAWPWEAEPQVAAETQLTTPASSANQTHRPGKTQGSNQRRTSLPEHLSDGLTGPGMTNETLMAVARHMLETYRPTSAEELASLIFQWFMTHHNGHARILNEHGEDTAHSWIRSVAQNLFDKWQSGNYVIRENSGRGRRDNPAAELREADVRSAIEIIPSPQPGSPRRVIQNYRGALLFFLDLLRCCKGKLLAGGEDITTLVHEVQLPVQTIKGLAGAGVDKARRTYYIKRLALLEQSGVIVSTSEPSRGKCIRYTLNFSYALDGPVVDDHVSWLGRTLGV